MASVPLLTAAATAYFLWLRGPYFYGGNFEPSYVYLFNSLLLAVGEPPAHVDHPGTSLQLIGAAVLWLRHGFGGGDFVGSVIDASESSLRAAHLLLLAGLFAGQVMLGIRTLKLTKSPWLAAFLQAFPLTSIVTFHHLQIYAPEVLLLAVGSVMMAVAAPALLIGGRVSGRCAGGLGALAGVAVMAKVTFLPLLGFFLVYLEGKRARLWFLAGVAGVAAVLVVPVLPSLSTLIDWYADLATASEAYGRGDRTTLSHLASILGFLSIVVHQEFFASVCFVLLGLGVIKVVAGAWSRRSWRLEAGERTLASLFIMLVLSFGLVFVHPGLRYLLPAIALAPVMAYLSWRTLGQGRPWAGRLVAGVLGAAALVQIYLFHGYHGEVVRRAMGDTLVVEYLNQPEQAGATVAYGFGSNELAYALATGNRYSRLHFSGWLMDRYPDYLEYDRGLIGANFPGGREDGILFRGFDKPIDLQDRILPGGRFLLHSSRSVGQALRLPQGFSLERELTFEERVVLEIRRSAGDAARGG